MLLRDKGLGESATSAPELALVGERFGGASCLRSPPRDALRLGWAHGGCWLTPLRQGIDTSAPCTGKEGAMRFMMRTHVLALFWLFGACSEGTPVEGADAEGSAGGQPDVVAVFTPEDGSASEPTDLVGGADDADDRGDGPETDALDAPDAVEGSEGQCVTLECDDAGACEAVIKADGEPCDAPCFEAASCQAGECAPEPGSALSCAPSNTACVSAFECDLATGACTLPVYAPAGSACDTDDDVCSLERCDGGGACDFQGIETCAQARAENPCWEWSCKGKAGCVEALFDEGALCDDGNPCTGDDTCTKTGQGQEVCLGAPVDTDDDDPCTEDACVDGEVVHTPIPGCADSPCPGGCDDGDPCTSDACVDDACENLPIEGCIAECPSDCDDGNPCTDDACEDGVCVNSPNTAPCSDNDPCTASDQCAAGACVSGEPVACDDADPCTEDSCLSALGCQHIADASLEGCGTTCTPYAIEPCYTGPVGSAGVGRCRAGFRVCHQSGEAWSHCTHEVLPLSGELCANGEDDTCDGSQDGAGCNSAGVWVDGVMGSDTTGDGSFDKPWATIEQGLEGGPELVLIKSGDVPTVYLRATLSWGPSTRASVLWVLDPRGLSSSGALRSSTARGVTLSASLSNTRRMTRLQGSSTPLTAPETSFGTSTSARLTGSPRERASSTDSMPMTMSSSTSRLMMWS